MGRSNGWRIVVSASIALAVVAATGGTPNISVLWVIVALNLVLGQREDVPFSTYPMFSMPTRTAWALRFEDSNGELIAVGKIGLAPHVLRKRFGTEVRAAAERGINDISAARRRAAEVLATELEQHRPPGGPLAQEAIRIVLVEYILESGRMVRVQTPIMETTPR